MNRDCKSRVRIILGSDGVSATGPAVVQDLSDYETGQRTRSFLTRDSSWRALELF